MNYLSKICRYYLDCIGREHVEVSAFAADRYNNPDYVELGSLPTNTAQSRVIFSDPTVVQMLKKRSQARRPKDIYWGYPCRLRHIQSGRNQWAGFTVEPILIFKIDIDPQSSDGGSFGLAATPRLNYKALEGLLEGSAGNPGFLEVAAELAQDLGINTNPESSLEDLRAMFIKLQKLTPTWPWKEDVNPDSIQASPRFKELANKTQEGLYNRPVLILGDKSQYVAGLEAELNKLGKMSDEDIRGTALHRWLYGELGAPQADPSGALDPLLEVLPLNEEQREAVVHAIADPLVVITGPPGTGKSQVVTSILINSAWKGQRVLFSSKNNKAVDVVEARSNALSRRPFVLRLGSNDFQTKLSEYLSTYMTTTARPDDRANYDEAKKAHAQILTQQEALNNEIRDILKLRNEVDLLEQKMEPLRQARGSDSFAASRNMDIDKIGIGIQALRRALDGCDPAQSPWYVRLYWNTAKSRRYARFNASAKQVATLYSAMGVEQPTLPIGDDGLERWKSSVKEIEQRFDQALESRRYFELLTKLSSKPGIGEIAARLVDNSSKLSDVSAELWTSWLDHRPNEMSDESRRKVHELASILRMMVQTRVGHEMISRYDRLFSEVGNFLPCWATTALSARFRVPFEKAYFDLLVIDEASQCDIASVLPLLYRSKRAVIIGDPKQLRHISSTTFAQDQQLVEKHDLKDVGFRWSYTANSLFDLAHGLCAGSSQISLRDHHRSRREIIEFSNKCFYQSAPLRVATAYDRLTPPPDNQAVVRWIDCAGRVERPSSGGAYNRDEAKAVYQELRRLVASNYMGTIGVVTPFRAQATAIKDLISRDADLSARLDLRGLQVDVVHSFQGDERDLIIFSTVVSDGTHDGALRFLRANGNLFNVAVTRARSCLITVGDKRACLSGSVDYLSKFIRHVEQHQTHKYANGDIDAGFDGGPDYPMDRGKRVSDWEKILYRALYKAGIKSIPQHSEDKYVLDFAIKQGNRKLNIEVDGEMYHRAWNGELCKQDLLRNRRLIELGWDVMRFWVYEVRDDLPGCVERVQKWLSSADSARSSPAVYSVTMKKDNL